MSDARRDAEIGARLAELVQAHGGATSAHRLVLGVLVDPNRVDLGLWARRFGRSGRFSTRCLAGPDRTDLPYTGRYGGVVPLGRSDWRATMAASAWAVLHRAGRERDDLDAIVVGGADPVTLDAAAALFELLFACRVTKVLLGGPDVVAVGRDGRPGGSAATSPSPAAARPAGHRRRAWRAAAALAVPMALLVALVFGRSLIARPEEPSPSSRAPTASVTDPSVADAGPSPAPVPVASAAPTSTPDVGSAAAPVAAAPVSSSVGADGASACPDAVAVYVCIRAIVITGATLEVTYVAPQPLAYPRQGQLQPFAVFYLEGVAPPPVLHAFQPAPQGVRRVDSRTPYREGAVVVDRFGPTSSSVVDRPFALSDLSGAGGRLCAVVYVPLDTLLEGSGNCFPLPPH